MALPSSHPKGFRARAARIREAVALRASATAEAAYVRGLRGVMRGVHRAYEKALAPHVKALQKDAQGSIRQDALGKHSHDLDVLDSVVASHIATGVGPLFDKMARSVASVHAKALPALIGVRVSDLRIPGEVAKARDWNIRLVEDAARAYASQVRDLVGDPDLFGVRVEDLADAIEERGNVSESRAELIARDQTLKLNAQINETRQTNANVTSFVWSTSGDERVREAHAACDGITYSWDIGAPAGPDGELLTPGMDFQCRCVALPVIDELEGI